jgi:CheY-like chemotaxis protein
MKKSSILLVDDDQELRQAMRAWLAPLFAEWTFEEAACVNAAIGIVALHQPTQKDETKPEPS